MFFLHGKTKIVDRWGNYVHVIVARPNPSIPVFKVSPEGGKAVRTLHRNLLLPLSLPAEGYVNCVVPDSVDCSDENTVVETSDDSDVELMSGIGATKHRDHAHVSDRMDSTFSQPGFFLGSNSPDVDSCDKQSFDESLGHSKTREIVVLAEETDVESVHSNVVDATDDHSIVAEREEENIADEVEDASVFSSHSGDVSIAQRLPKRSRNPPSRYGNFVSHPMVSGIGSDFIRSLVKISPQFTNEIVYHCLQLHEIEFVMYLADKHPSHQDCLKYLVDNLHK